MTGHNTDAAELLGENGPLAAKPEFIPRRGQQEMAALVEKAIESQSHCVIEATSGAGKTFAYLTPLLARCEQDKQFKAVVSTATFYLQQQLYQRDLPFLMDAFRATISVALLRGRQHYLCPYYLEKTLQGKGLSDTVRESLLAINARFRQTGHGEISKVDSDISRYITCNSNDCLSTQCPSYEICPFYQSRAKAQKAQLLIVNHHLLFSSMETDNQLLEEVNAVVVDEAHRLADIGQGFSGDWISSGQLNSLITQTIQIIDEQLNDQLQVKSFLQQTQSGLTKLANHLPSLSNFQPNEHRQLIAQIRDNLASLTSWFAVNKSRHVQLDALAIILDNLYNCCDRIVEGEGLSWLQPQGRGFVIRKIPAQLSTPLRTHLDKTQQSWLFTSATLSIARQPDAFLRLVGLAREHFYSIDADINFADRAKLFMPTIHSGPNDPTYTQEMADCLSAVLEQVEGRALLLFSSYRALQACAQLIVDDSRDYFVQHSDSDHYQLINGFKASERAVLLGTGSFWEGLDLSGAKIALLMIDKLPFAAPDEPVVKLRSQYLDVMGVDSFNEYILPDAVIRFRQGCGRLLRRLTDRGVIMLPDHRLQTMNYGPVFLDSLPSMDHIREVNDIAEFFSAPQLQPLKETVND